MERVKVGVVASKEDIECKLLASMLFAASFFSFSDSILSSLHSAIRQRKKRDLPGK